MRSQRGVNGGPALAKHDKSLTRPSKTRGARAGYGAASPFSVTLMSKSHGWVERAVLELLQQNEWLGAPTLTSLIYRTDAELQAGEWFVTASERASVRRALANLQKQGHVVKLGHLKRSLPAFRKQDLVLGNTPHKERCSYANRETAIAIVSRHVWSYGKDSLWHWHPHLARLYAESKMGRYPSC